MRPQAPPDYLAGYPAALVQQVRQLSESGRLGALLLEKYPARHTVRTDRALYDYVFDLKSLHLGRAAALSKVAFDGKLHIVRHALGTHTSISRVQGGRLKAKHEIRIAALFRDMPVEFLRMIVVHELAHLREREHDKAFYQLCRHMEPDYHQLEFDLRAYLFHREATGESVWAGNSRAARAGNFQRSAGATDRRGKPPTAQEGDGEPEPSPAGEAASPAASASSRRSHSAISEVAISE